MVKVINSNSKLERMVLQISSNLDQVGRSDNKAPKTLYMLVYFKHFSASVVAVSDTRHSAATDVIVGQNQYDYYSIWLIVGRNQYDYY